MSGDLSVIRSPSNVVDLDALERDVDRLHAEYMAAEPYPHMVFDDFLTSEAVSGAVREFPPLDPHQWNNYLHANERKYSNTDPDTWGPTLQEVLAVLNSPRFVAFVGKLIGVDDLLPDPTLEGGGLHQSTTGGFLNMHADFTVHPHNRKLRRRANILLYLNPEWKPEYGGDLEMWDKGMTRCVRKVSPVANRVLIFSTEQDSFHGHPDPMTCPEGVARRSLALYYFSLEDDPLVRSTEYRSRPGDGMHAVTIWFDKQLLRTYDWAKRHLGISDRLAQKVLRITDRLTRKGPPSSA